VTPAGTSVAKRPEARTVTVRVSEGLYAGWEATARADFPARILFDLQGKDAARALAAVDAIILSHNLPDERGELAASMADVDPGEGAWLIVGMLFDAIGALPNR
jgi:hypothetical protein